jgi:hypothetical protein
VCIVGAWVGADWALGLVDYHPYKTFFSFINSLQNNFLEKIISRVLSQIKEEGSFL